MPTTVTDSKGVLIEGLSAEDFVLTDDGKVREIRLDTSDTVLAPVALVLAVESNEISVPVLAKVRGTGGILQSLVAGERGQTAIIAYEDGARVLESFTADSMKIRTALSRLQPETQKKGTLLDAVAEGVRLLSARPDRDRRVMVIIGESRDRGSKEKLPKVIEAAQRAGVAIFALTYSVQKAAWTAKPQDNPNAANIDLLAAISEPMRLGMVNAAEALTSATGGRHLGFTTLAGLESALGRTGEEIHAQYLLSFAPEETANKKFHRLAVRVPSRQAAIVRSRPGYWP